MSKTIETVSKDQIIDTLLCSLEETTRIVKAVHDSLLRKPVPPGKEDADRRVRVLKSFGEVVLLAHGAISIAELSKSVGVWGKRAPREKKKRKSS